MRRRRRSAFVTGDATGSVFVNVSSDADDFVRGARRPAVRRVRYGLALAVWLVPFAAVMAVLFFADVSWRLASGRWLLDPEIPSWMLWPERLR